LKTEEITLPKVSLKLLPGFGVQLSLHTKVGLHGSGALVSGPGVGAAKAAPVGGAWPPGHAPSIRSRSPLGGLLQLAAEVKVSSRVALGVSARRNAHPHPQALQHAPGPHQPALRPCPVVDSVLGVVNELLGAVLCLMVVFWAEVSSAGPGALGALGSVEFTLATLPLISNQYIELDISPIVKSVAGDIIDFPKPPNPIKVPPKEDHTSQVTVPLYLFNTVFGLLQTIGALDLDITLELVSSSVPLTTTELAALVPETLRKLPPGQQLLLSLWVKEAPTVTLQDKKAMVSVPANIHVLSYLPKGTREAFFQLNRVMTLNAQLAPSATKLHLSLSLERLSVKLASSFAHAFVASSWEGEQLGIGEGLQVGVERKQDESWAI
ncbi:BPI fold-containing family B member 3, partial [Eschrichtius robustus]|nr:BPI fold-containing family B member 3 [Eschrichtius robustus]